MDVETVSISSLAAGRAVGDALPREAVEPLYRQAAPGYPAGENNRSRAQNVTGIEVQFTGRGIYPGDRSGHEDLRACRSVRLANSSPETPDGKPR